MYVRQVSMELIPNGQSDFIRNVDSEILPLLRKQKGFKDEITMFSPHGKNVVTCRLRRNDERAESCGRRPYSDASEMLSEYAPGTPRAKAF